MSAFIQSVVQNMLTENLLGTDIDVPGDQQLSYCKPRHVHMHKTIFTLSRPPTYTVFFIICGLGFWSELLSFHSIFF